MLGVKETRAALLPWTMDFSKPQLSITGSEPLRLYQDNANYSKFTASGARSATPVNSCE